MMIEHYRDDGSMERYYRISHTATQSHDDGIHLDIYPCVITFITDFDELTFLYAMDRQSNEAATFIATEYPDSRDVRYYEEY